MTNEDAIEVIRAVIHEIAPEGDLDQVSPDETIQEALDMDSIDFLNFVIGLNERTGVDIPEHDYPQLATVDGCVRYLVSKAGAHETATSTP